LATSGAERSTPHRSTPSIEPLKPVDIDHGLCKGLCSLLRQVVAYAARDVAMHISADVLLGIDARLSMRCVIRIAFQRDRRQRDRWKRRDPRFQLVVFRSYIALSTYLERGPNPQAA
jgi:hypothetical protein